MLRLEEVETLTGLVVDACRRQVRSGEHVIDHVRHRWLAQSAPALLAEARLQGYSSAPIIEMLIPSTIDDSLAPPGAHVASLFCQHFAPELPDGSSWDDHREAVKKNGVSDKPDYHFLK